MKRTGKKLTAWLLAAMIAITSAQLPNTPVYAQEQAQELPNLPADTIGTDTPADQTTPPADEDTDVPDDGQHPETPDDGQQPETPEEDQPETPSDNPETPDDSQQAETPDDGQTDAPGNKSETPDDREQPENPDEEQNDHPEEPNEPSEKEIFETVSANTLYTAPLDGESTEITLELDGVYQFGGSPTNKDTSALYAARSVEDPENLDAAIDYLYEQISLGNKIVDFSTLKIPFHNDYDSSQPDKPSADVQTVTHLLTGLLNEHPDIFWFMQQRNVSYYSDSTGSYLGIIDFSQSWNDDLYAKREAVNNAVLSAKAAVTNSADPLQTAIELHDYLAVNCEYDIDN